MSVAQKSSSLPFVVWLGALLLAPPASRPSAPPSSTSPTSPLDYFRRADDLTNIRLPGSQPLHMKVTFHACPAYDVCGN